MSSASGGTAAGGNLDLNYMIQLIVLIYRYICIHYSNMYITHYSNMCRTHYSHMYITHYSNMYITHYSNMYIAHYSNMCRSSP